MVATKLVPATPAEPPLLTRLWLAAKATFVSTSAMPDLDALIAKRDKIMREDFFVSGIVRFDIRPLDVQPKPFVVQPRPLIREDRLDADGNLLPFMMVRVPDAAFKKKVTREMKSPYGQPRYLASLYHCLVPFRGAPLTEPLDETDAGIARAMAYFQSDAWLAVSPSKKPSILRQLWQAAKTLFTRAPAKQEPQPMTAASLAALLKTKSRDVVDWQGFRSSEPAHRQAGWPILKDEPLFLSDPGLAEAIASVVIGPAQELQRLTVAEQKKLRGMTVAETQSVPKAPSHIPEPQRPERPTLKVQNAPSSQLLH
jgi:hypothetical protein